MKTFLTLLILLFVITGLSAQNKAKVTITGIVLDNTSKEPVEQAGIRVLNARDSSYVSGSATNASGKFSLQVNPGRYVVQISFIGYTDEFVNVNARQAQNDIGSISLKDDAIMLSEAVVVAKAAEIVVRGDTVEYNADSYKVQESAVVEDLLKKMPGVEISSEGKITVNGKEVQKILVDGKEFFSDDPKVASKNLPASMVEKLQVLDRKSDMAQMTGFDDGNEETVINLTVRPGMKQGVFGSAFVGHGNKDRKEGNAMVNYMRNKNQFTVLAGGNNTNNAGFTDFASTTFGGNRPRGLNFGAGNGITESVNGGGNFALEPSDKLKYNGDVRFGQTDTDVEIKSNTQNFIQEDKGGDQFKIEDAAGRNKSQNINANFRFEWTPDSATTIIFRPEIRYRKNDNWQNSDFLTTKTDITDSINWGNSEYFATGDGLRLNGDLNISRQLNKNGRVLSFRFGGGVDNSDSNGINKSDTYFGDVTKPDQIIDQVFNQDDKSYNWSAYASYVEPIGRNNFIQLAYAYRKNHSESDKRTYKSDGLGNYNVIDTAYTKDLRNDFVNQSIELNFKSVREKYNYTVGVEIQPSSSSSRTMFADTMSYVKNSVVNFSPTAQFNYIWDRRTNLRINYRGITNQPSVTQLSDVVDITDALNQTKGNPDLKPSFEQRLDLRYRKFNPEQASAFLIFGRFSYLTNDIVNYSETEKDGTRSTTYKNVNGNMNGNLRVIYNTPLKNKKFSINSMTFGSYSRNNGFINSDKNTAQTYRFQESIGLEFRSDRADFGLRGNFTYNNITNSLQGQVGRETFNYGGNANATLYLPYDFTVESDLNYSANSGYTAGYKQDEWLWNASVAKQIFKAKNGTLRFKIYDILKERSNISRTSTADYIRDTTTNTLNSYFMFHFVYKFQMFKGGAKQGDMERGGPGRGFGPGGPPRI